MHQEELKRILSHHGLKISNQRLEILDLLTSTDMHPTADEVYRAINVGTAVTSRATVYNTLHKLTEKGVLISLDFGDNQTRYDVSNHPHGHFVCNQCQMIYNIPLPEDLPTIHPPGFVVDSQDLTLRGTCPKCLKKSS